MPLAHVGVRPCLHPHTHVLLKHAAACTADTCLYINSTQQFHVRLVRLSQLWTAHHPHVCRRLLWMLPQHDTAPSALHTSHLMKPGFWRLRTASTSDISACCRALKGSAASKAGSVAAQVDNGDPGLHCCCLFVLGELQVLAAASSFPVGLLRCPAGDCHRSEPGLLLCFGLPLGE